jgi:hypothetical protein
MDPILQGLQVSLLGLMITFLALCGFILLIEALKRLFPAKDEAPGGQGEELVVVEEPPLLVETADPADEGAVVAAIAVALSRAQAVKRGPLGDELTRGRGNWWSARGLRKRE